MENSSVCKSRPAQRQPGRSPVRGSAGAWGAAPVSALTVPEVSVSSSSCVMAPACSCPVRWCAADLRSGPSAPSAQRVAGREEGAPATPLGDRPPRRAQPQSTKLLHLAAVWQCVPLSNPGGALVPRPAGWREAWGAGAMPWAMASAAAV